MTENVGQLGNVLFDAVKHPGEQVAQVMGKYFLRVDTRFLTQGFHLPPDICPIDGLARASHENHPAFDPLLRCVAEQFLPQRLHKKHRPGLCLTAYHRLAAPCCLNSDKLQLTDPDAGAADGLQNQTEPFIVLSHRCPAEPCVFRFRQFLFFGAVNLLLQFQRFYLQVVPAEKGE